MLQFKKITLADKAAIQRYTLQSERMNCDLSFANLYSWHFFYGSEWAEAMGALFFRYREEGELRYMLPVTPRLTREMVEAMETDAASQGCPFVIAGVCLQTLPILEGLMPGRFAYTANRDFFDYVYHAADLATLAGKKYQPKRNHLNRFKTAYPDYEFLPLTPELVGECLKMEQQWFASHDAAHSEALLHERRSMTRALQAMEQLDIEGGVLRVGGKTVAFTYGAPINQSTFDVCVEKADLSVEGAYTAVNNEFARRIAERYAYINREEDLGIDGLRQAKLSYQPAILLEKYIARLAE
jgi:hypothetical protein